MRHQVLAPAALQVLRLLRERFAASMLGMHHLVLKVIE